MRVEHDNPRDESIPVDAPREGDRAGDEPPGPVATQESDVAGERPGEAPDDEAVLEDVDSGEFPPESGETAGHAEEDAWLRSESAPADEVSVGEPASGEPAVGVAAVPAPGAVTAPEAVPVTAVPPAPRSAGFGTGNGGSRDGGSRDEAAIRDAAAAREAAAQRDDAEARDEAEASDVTEAPDEAEAREAQAPDEAEAPAAAEPEELAPGEVPVATVATIWEAEVVDGYRDRWQQLQLRFIDDPRQAAEQAQGLVTDVCQGLTNALDRHRNELDRWGTAQLDDTEELRTAVRRYRDLLDRLLGL